MSTTNEQPSMFRRIMRRVSNSNVEDHQEHAIDTSLPPLPPLKLSGYKPSTRQHLMDNELAENIRNLLPPRNQLYEEWEMVYSLEQHGISLRTLYRNCDPHYQREKSKQRNGGVDQHGYADSIVRAATTGSFSGVGSDFRRHSGYVLVIKDECGNKFGAYLSEHLRALDGVYHYGNGECFLWKCEKCEHNEFPTGGAKNSPEDSPAPPKQLSNTRFKAFMHTGLNRNTIYSNLDCISIGSSQGRNGLWIDKSMERGVSYVCDTFGNEVLNHSSSEKCGKFKIMGLEVWRVGPLQDS